MRDFADATHVQLAEGDTLPRDNSIYVLVVDDDRAIREAVEEILLDEGLVVRLASDGREGLEVCASSPLPDLILLDISMPVMDGHEFARRQQQSPALASIPLCVMTALGRSSPLPTTAAAILHKPFGARDLMDVVNRLCS